MTQLHPQDDLLLRLDFRDPTPEVIDLSPVGALCLLYKKGKSNVCQKTRSAHHLVTLGIWYLSLQIELGHQVSTVSWRSVLLPAIWRRSRDSTLVRSRFTDSWNYRFVKFLREIPSSEEEASMIVKRGLDLHNQLTFFPSYLAAKICFGNSLFLRDVEFLFWCFLWCLIPLFFFWEMALLSCLFASICSMIDI